MNGPGWINWPTDMDNTGEGGMWVYAMVLADDARDFIHCCGPAATLALPLPDVVVDDRAHVYPPVDNDCWRAVAPINLDTESGLRHYRAAVENQVLRRVTHGSPVLAAVCLGSSGGSWTDERDYWRCAPIDLTDAGRALVRSLESLYDAPVALVTYLDT